MKIRHAQDIGEVRDFLTLLKGAEKKGRFFCEDCKANLTEIIKRVPNDGRQYSFRCPGCGRAKKADAGMLAVAAMAQSRKVNRGEQSEKHSP